MKNHIGSSLKDIFFFLYTTLYYKEKKPELPPSKNHFGWGVTLPIIREITEYYLNLQSTKMSEDCSPYRSLKVSFLVSSTISLPG